MSEDSSSMLLRVIPVEVTGLTGRYKMRTVWTCNFCFYGMVFGDGQFNSVI